MAVEHDRFHFGERGVVAIDVAPARLNHRKFRLDEIRHGAAEKIRGRNKVCIENGDEFACRGFQSFLEGAGFESFAIVAVDVGDGNAQSLMPFDAVARDGLRLVGGIIEHLDIEQFARIIELRDGFDRAAQSRSARCRSGAGLSLWAIP